MTHLFPIDLITCVMFQSGVFEHSEHFLALLCVSDKTFVLPKSDSVGFTKLWMLECFSAVLFGTKTLFKKLLGLKWDISCKKKITNIFEGHSRSTWTQATRLLSMTVVGHAVLWVYSIKITYFISLSILDVFPQTNKVAYSKNICNLSQSDETLY